MRKSRAVVRRSASQAGEIQHCKPGAWPSRNRSYILAVNQRADPDDVSHTRLSARAGAVLSVAVALLLAMLPGVGLTGAQPLSTIGAAHADQSLLTTANRLSEARAELGKARDPKAPPDFGDAPVLLAAALAAAFLLVGTASLRPPLARVSAPRRWPSTARARAPPRA